MQGRGTWLSMRRTSTRTGSVARRCASLPSVSIISATLNLHQPSSLLAAKQIESSLCVRHTYSTCM